MLAGETDKMLGHRLETLEKGVHVLDDRVKSLDDKVKSSSVYKVLKYLKSKNKKTQFFFLIGADNLVKFHKWNNWKKIPKIAKIIVFPRKGYSFKYINSIGLKRLAKKDWVYVNSKKVNISSSLIRKFW